eukprot:tig00001206_g7493.t1
MSAGVLLRLTQARLRDRPRRAASAAQPSVENEPAGTPAPERELFVAQPDHKSPQCLAARCTARTELGNGSTAESKRARHTSRALSEAVELHAGNATEDAAELQAEHKPVDEGSEDELVAALSELGLPTKFGGPEKRHKPATAARIKRGKSKESRVIAEGEETWVVILEDGQALESSLDGERKDNGRFDLLQWLQGCFTDVAICNQQTQQAECCIVPAADAGKAVELQQEAKNASEDCEPGLEVRADAWAHYYTASQLGQYDSTWNDEIKQKWPTRKSHQPWKITMQ